MIGERMMLKRNKAATSNLTSLSLTSPTSPTLENFVVSLSRII